MKRTLYYISPFVIIPIIFLITSLLEGVEILEPTAPYFAYTALFLFTVMLGALSQLKTTFDYIITALLPLSVFFALFLFLFFDEGCNGRPQLSLYHALSIEYYRPWFLRVLVMMVITFVFTFKPLRQFIKNIISVKNFKK